MFDAASLALGLFGGAGGTLLVERYRHRNELRHRGAEALGPIFTLLVDAEPDRLGMNAEAHSQAHIEELWKRLAECNTALETLATELRPASGKKAEALAVALHNSLHQSSWLVADLTRRSEHSGMNIEQTRDRANSHHSEARELAAALRADLRGARRWPRIPRAGREHR